MTDQNSKPKSKRILWLWLLLVIVIIVIAVSVYLSNASEELFPQKPKDILAHYKSSANKIINEDSNKIQELQTTIATLQQKIANSNVASTVSNQSLQFAVYSNLLLNRILRGDSFAVEIEPLLSLTHNPILKNKLEKIKPSADLGIKTQQELIETYKSVYKDTYLAYLKTHDSLFSKIKYYFLYLIFIKQNHDVILEDDTVSSILSNVETYLANNNYKKAYTEFIKVDMVPNNNTQQWLSNLMDKINAEDTIVEINNELTKYIAESR
ncbi:MAG: hypothetical protein LBQ34_01415 [Alphaproteobacteria bacterium]|nr:hypothetical protein [Alphaproteobacteria bacterium]